LQATVDRLQEDYRKLESQCALKDKMLVQQDDVNIKRAVTAETGLECATERIKELQSQLGNMQTTVKDAKKAEAELARLREEEPKMKEAAAKVTELEEEIHRFRQKEGTISERYRQGLLVSFFQH
jgi:DNA repair exonuclease SbcCD ATPase subunit